MLISRQIVPKYFIGGVVSIVDFIWCGVVWYGLYFRGGAAEISKKDYWINQYYKKLLGPLQTSTEDLANTN